MRPPFCKVFAICLAICLPRLLLLLPPGPVDFDGVDFVLALDDYDLGRLQPHFPGYPLYVLAGRLLRPAAGSAAYGLLGLLAAAGLATCLRCAAACPIWGWGAALLWLALPGVWLESLASHADLPALCGLGVAWLAVERDRPLAAGLAAGLALGLRPSALPLLSVLLAAGSLRKPGGWLRAAGGLALGLALWLPWFVAQVGPAELLAQGKAFSAGHFGAWGQTAFSGPALALRPGLFLRGLTGAAGLGQLWTALAACGLVVGLARRGLVPGAGWWLWTAPYGLWLLIGQNLARGRHYLPLLLACCWLLTRLRARLPGLRALLLALILLATLGAVPRAARQARGLAPAARAALLAGHVEQRLGVVLLAGDAVPRFADQLQPRLQRRRVRSFADLDRYLRGLWQGPDWLVASSELAGHPPEGARLLQRYQEDRGWGSETLELYLWRAGRP